MACAAAGATDAALDERGLLRRRPVFVLFILRIAAFSREVVDRCRVSVLMLECDNETGSELATTTRREGGHCFEGSAQLAPLLARVGAVSVPGAAAFASLLTTASAACPSLACIGSCRRFRGGWSDVV